MDQAIARLGNMDSEPQGESTEMSCEDVRDLLYLFVTNELDEDESQQVCTHLLSCAECRQAMAEHVKLTGAMKRSIPGIQLRYYSRNN
jgi:anti-sigma factor RsiW